MTKIIRLQKIRLAVVFGLLAFLAAWQHEFILHGIASNPYLNLAIIGVFLFGSIHACIGLASLGNEARALRALQEVYQDAVTYRTAPDMEALADVERCRRPGLVYRSPKLLGHVFDLTLEELLRTHHMRIGVGTMQTLVHAIEQRIAIDRSLLVYITGLSVFLGLIGTFIGLMDMVGSVGGIIGSLARSDAGDASAMKQLIHDLEAPLVGMATGFSSSLFGLFGSLVLGLVGRFVNQAMLSVRDEFEAWLAGISQIEVEVAPHGQANPAAPAAPAAAGLGLLVQLRRSGDALDRAATAVRELADQHAESASALVRNTAQTETVARHLIEVTRSLARIDDLERQLTDQRNAIQLIDERIGRQIESTLVSIEDGAGRRHADTMSAVLGLAARQEQHRAEAAAQAAGLLEATTSLRRAQDATRDELREGWAALRREAIHLAGSIASTVGRAEEMAREALQRVESRLDGVDSRSAEIETTSAKVEAAVRQLLEASGLQGTHMGEQISLLKRVADGHLEARQVLVDLARNVERQPQALALAVGTGLAAVARSVEDLERAMQRNADADSKAVAGEVLSAARAIERKVASGFTELARSFETTFVAYADLLRTVAHQNADPEQDRGPERNAG